MEQKSIWWIVLVVVAIILALFQYAQPQAILSHHRSMSSCTDDLAEEKQDSPNGYFPDKCVLATQGMSDCIIRELNSMSLEDDVGDNVWYGDPTGDMDKTEQTKYDCIHAPICGQASLDSHGRCCTMDQAALDQAASINSGCQKIYYTGGLKCVQCISAGGGNCNPGDTNCDGKIDRTELGTQITNWIQGVITRDNLGGYIMKWVSN